MKFRISSEYGVMEEIRNGRVHHGIDLAMPRGTELHSIAEGTVERVVDYGATNLGKGIFIRSEDGSIHVYGHLDKVIVHRGDHVDSGDLIGLSGNTGHSSGPHLHFGLIKDGHFTDPTPLVEAVQNFSGEIAGPGIFQVKGPASWIIDKAMDGSFKEHVKSNIQEHIHDFLVDAGAVLFELSFSIGLIGCASLIILGAMGLKDGYRWAGLTFGACALVRLLLGGSAS
ncbi:M23 family metallopeptidase [Paenibacillus sp. NRS-1760]|uniref:M23 family metallopeptidase n=1 Tax=Paenibacillus sp. NRS-1760 TaxID=3233902 RepID=UPI003D2ACB2C